MIYWKSGWVLTVDTNVLNYSEIYEHNKQLPSGLRVNRMYEFCKNIINKIPIALNKFIQTEYEQTMGSKHIRTWIKKRIQFDLIVFVDCKPLPSNVNRYLHNNYGFNIRSFDCKFLQTCYNTDNRHFVTQNLKHFDRPYKSRGRISMRKYLKRKINLKILTIDESCNEILEKS